MPFILGRGFAEVKILKFDAVLNKCVYICIDKI